jgi:aerotaxis receptor
MKINLPVTNVERKLDPSKPVVTKTDLKGQISYANEAFIEISGFSREELLGASHNTVRHPDMPPEAFADLWRCIGAGHPWRGLVKNRCKNGDYYWVEAFVTPITENGHRIGYMSVRSAPRSEDIAAAEQLYREVKQKSKSFPATRLPTSTAKAGAVNFSAAGATCLLAIVGAWLGGAAGLACAGVAGLAAVGSAVATHRRIIIPARRAGEAISRLDEGQLAQRIEVPGGPLGDVYVRLESLRIHLRAMFADVLVSAGNIEAKSRRLDEAMRALGAASEAQTDNVQQVSAAMEQMSVSISEVSSNTDLALTAARHTEEAANSGMEMAAASLASQRKAADVVSQSSQQITEVNRAIGRITDISKIIRDIAEQTNLLALNAAIEAARAGDQGRGFAVVADEVRKLSERTASSTMEISKAVVAIVDQSGNAVTCMAKATSEVGEGAQRVEENSGKLKLIWDASREAVRVSREISAMLQEQSAASQEVANSMERITAATESSHISIADVGTSATSLRATADELRLLLRHMERALQ